MATDVTPIIPIPVDILQQIASMLRKTWIPKIERGTIHISLAGWKQVNFAEAFKQVPTVGALLLAKAAWYVDDLFQPPNLDFSGVKQKIIDGIEKVKEIDKISVDVPELPSSLLCSSSPNICLDEKWGAVADGLGERLYDKLTKYFPALKLADIVGGAKGAMGDIFRDFGVEIAEAFDNYAYKIAVRNPINKFSDTIEGRINAAIEKARSRINEFIRTLKNTLIAAVDNALAAIEKVTTQITTYTSDALNKSIDKFWAMTGQEEGTIPSFAAVDNVTQTGFKVLAPSICTIHWWAFGEFIVPGEPIASRIETIIQQYTP